MTNPIPVPEGAPQWLAVAWPAMISTLFALVVALLLWAGSSVIKAIIKSIGRRRMTQGEVFEGSTWDLGGSLSQFVILLMGAPLVIVPFGLNIGSFLSGNAAGILTAIIILFAGFAIARWLALSIRSFGERARSHKNTDDTLFRLGASIGRYMVMVLAIILALQAVGFNPGTLIAVVGAVGLAIALALQDTLRAVAAGVLIAVFRPFSIGDWVEIAGKEGEVIDITPFQLTVKQVDNRAVIIPNDKAWSDPITNYSRYSERRLNLFFDVAYEDDPAEAMDIVRQTISALPRCRRPLDIWTGVHELGASSVTLRVRPWCARADVLDFKSDCLMAVKSAFEAAGITIPFPQQVEYTRPFAEIAPKKAIMSADASDEDKKT
ncbi:MAG: mechanosensitive ion channel family protein [Pseudomonadota bacterium]